MVSREKIHHISDLLGFVAWVQGEMKGLITYAIMDSECEIG